MKRIKNFDSIYVNSNSQDTHFVQCPSMFIMPRKIISNVYPDFPDAETLKIYIYLSKHCASTDVDGQTPGDVFIGKERIEIVLNMTPNTVNKAIDWLERNHFILNLKKKRGRTVLRRVLAAPDYLPRGNPAFYSCQDAERTLEALKDSNHGYIMIPTSLFSEQMLSASKSKSLRFMGKSPIWEQSHWDRRKMKILMLLYSHFWIRYFGGIDPSIVTVDYDSSSKEGYLNVHPSFFFDIKEDQKAVERTIASFIEKGLFKPVLVIIRELGYGESGYAGDVTSNYLPYEYDKQVYVLRPTFMFSKQVEEYKLGGLLIP
jgi:hypothetical protein